MKGKNLTNWFALISILSIFSITMYEIINKAPSSTKESEYSIVNAGSKFRTVKDGIEFTPQCLMGVSYLYYDEGNGHRAGVSPYLKVDGKVRQCSGIDTMEYTLKCIDNVSYIYFIKNNGHTGGISPMYNKDSTVMNCTY